MSGRKSREGIWEFALGFYARPGVAPALLRLQDECGADVCLLLVLLWRAAKGTRLDAPQIAALNTAAIPWQARVRPLRAARRALRDLPEAEAQYEQAKREELEMERRELLALAEAAPSGGPGSGATMLTDYAALLGVVFPPEALEAINSASA